MPRICTCPNGHVFTEAEAEELEFVCDQDGEPITCEDEGAGANIKG